jgi:hypothetical protein
MAFVSFTRETAPETANAEAPRIPPPLKTE